MPHAAPSTRRAARRALLTSAIAAGLALGLASPALAAFPGTNGLIAFSRGGQIWTQTPGNPVSQVQRTTIGDNGDAVWSPDGTRIAFSSDRGGGLRQIFIQAVPGSEPTNPTASGPADLTMPAWSPDGSRIAFQQGNDADADVVVATLLGSIAFSPVTVAGGSGEQATPTWSADGSRIFFTEGGNLSVVNADGTGRRPVVADAGRPDVAPDGSSLAVVRSGQVTLLNGDGSGNVPLTVNSGGSPVFSPDGQRIVFNHFTGAATGIDLFTVGAAAGASIDQETFASGNDFGPDWQAIGPAPLINQLSGALVAGSAGGTLVVDGAGFVRRSVVRWNGTNRATAFVNAGRLTATLTAADLAAVGTGQVTVFTSPLGGGLSAPKTASISPPPPPPGPRILVASSSVSVKWSQSRIRGKLVIKGTLERAGKIEIALLRRTVVVRKRTVNLPAGPFSTKLVLTGKLAPGTLKLRLREVGGGLVAAEKSITIPAPPEGVVSQALVSATKGGPAALSLRNKSKLFARFTFAALPRKGQLTTTWIAPNGQSKVNLRPRTRVVEAEVASRSGVLRPSGTWRCVLKAGKRVVAVAKVRLS